MAQFPLNPKVGQSFLPNDEDVIYVWNGYTWQKRELASSIRLFVSADRTDSSVFLFNSVTRTADASSSPNSDSAFLLTSPSLTTIELYLRQSSASSNSCRIDVLRNANGSAFTTATSITNSTQTISSADTVFVYTFSGLVLAQYDSIHIQVTPGVGGTNTYFGVVTVE